MLSTRRVLRKELRIEELLLTLRKLKTRKPRSNLVSVTILMTMMPASMMMKSSEMKRERKEEERVDRRKRKCSEREEQDQPLRMKIWPVRTQMMFQWMLEAPLERAEER